MPELIDSPYANAFRSGIDRERSYLTTATHDQVELRVRIADFDDEIDSRTLRLEYLRGRREAVAQELRPLEEPT